MLVFRFAGSVKSDDHMRKIGCAIEGIDDVTQCILGQFRVETGQYQRHRAVFSKLVQLSL